MGTCPSCGVEFADGSNFCANCGVKLGVAEETERTRENSTLTDLSDKLKNKAKSFAGVAKRTAEATATHLVENEKAIKERLHREKKKTSDGDSPFGIRKQEYAGIILKCPNCGASITRGTAICKECGYHITEQVAATAVRAFNVQLMEIERRRKSTLGKVFIGRSGLDPVDQQKLSLIRSFPIPNNIDDIFEFVTLAVANIDVGLSKNTLQHKLNIREKRAETVDTIATTISDAWVSKLQQLYQKAKNAFPKDPTFESIKKIYFDKMRELKYKIDE